MLKKVNLDMPRKVHKNRDRRTWRSIVKEKSSEIEVHYSPKNFIYSFWRVGGKLFISESEDPEDKYHRISFYDIEHPIGPKKGRLS